MMRNRYFAYSATLFGSTATSSMDVGCSSGDTGVSTAVGAGTESGAGGGGLGAGATSGAAATGSATGGAVSTSGTLGTEVGAITCPGGCSGAVAVWTTS